MSLFTLAISCLTTFSLPWFMDLTFQVPTQCCSLQHQTWLTPPVTSTTGCCFCFGCESSFFLEVFLHSSPVAYWAPADFGSSCPIFLPFHTVHGVLKVKILKWFVILFSSGPRFVRTFHHDPSVLAGPHGTALSFIELDKAVVHVIRLVSFLWLWFSFCLEFFLQWSPVTYWAPTNLGSSSFSVLSFCLFILFMGFKTYQMPGQKTSLIKLVIGTITIQRNQ